MKLAVREKPRWKGVMPQQRTGAWSPRGPWGKQGMALRRGLRGFEWIEVRGVLT